MTRSILIITSFLFFAACSKQEDHSNESTTEENTNTITLTAEQLKTANIKTGKPEKKILSGSISVNGMLDVPPQNLVTISAPMGGFIKDTHLLQGMHVRKGEPLVELEDMEYVQLQQDYLDNKSQLDYAKAEYERQTILAKENVNAQKALQQAKAQYESLHARVEGLKAKLHIINITPEKLEKGTIQPTIKIYSPIQGYVTVVNVNLGQHVNATDVLFKIVDASHLHAELYVFEQDIPKLKLEQKVTFSLINETTQRIASIHLIGREISNDRTVRVHCHLEQEDKNLLPGMFVKAIIETDSKEVNTLPDEAIVNFEGNNYIFVTTDQKTFTMTPIKTGISEKGSTEVILSNNWKEDNSIATAGAFELLSMLKNAEEEE